jgi:hypothetical protein
MRLFSSAFVLLLLALACRAIGVGTPAGTTIELVVEGTFVDSMNQPRVATPGRCALTVEQVAAVAIEHGPNPVQAVPGTETYIPLRIHNLGNGNDGFNLSLATSQGWDVTLIYDDNADGLHQQSEQWEITTAGLMIADGYTPCFAKVVVPRDAETSEHITVTAESMFDPIGAWTSAELVVEVPDAPSVSITNPTTDATYATTSPTLSISGTTSCGQPITVVAWSSDQGTGGTCSGTTEWAASDIALQPGDNVITVTATDSSGRTATDSITVTYSDVGAPTVTITGPTSEPTFYTESATITISGTASDNAEIASVRWSSDRGSSGSCVGSTSWEALGVPLLIGQNVITITAIDEAGNSGSDVLVVTYSKDTSSPTIQITSPTSSDTYTTNTSTISLAGTASDDVGVTSVTWSNAQGGSGTCAFNGAKWTASEIRLAIGNNIITITAFDGSGKTGVDTITVNYTAQNAPSVVITGPTSASTYTTLAETISLSGTAEHDAGITAVAWSNNRGGSGACSGTTAWVAQSIPLLPGQNTILITARAATGNTGTDTIVVTRSSPSVSITWPTRDATYTTDHSPLTVSGTAMDDRGITRVAWSNSRGGSGTCSGTTAWSASRIVLASGENVITISAEDAAGNVATDVLTVTYNPDSPTPPQDTTAPTVTITEPTAQATCSRNCPISVLAGTASDDTALASVGWANAATGDTGSCTVTGTSWTSSQIAMAEGANPLTITATDTAGNSATASLTITYVNTEPGDAWKGLAMVSLPIIPDDADPQAATGFEEDGWCSFLTASNRYAVYPDRATWFEPASATPGRGFWAYFESASVPYGTVPAQDRPATIHLLPGWNLIGTPFVSDVTWDLGTVTVKEPTGVAAPLREMTGVVAGFLWGWRQDATDPTRGSYYLVYDAALASGVENRIRPWQAYWIRAYRECDLIIPPPAP